KTKKIINTDKGNNNKMPDKNESAAQNDLYERDIALTCNGCRTYNLDCWYDDWISNCLWLEADQINKDDNIFNIKVYKMLKMESFKDAMLELVRITKYAKTLAPNEKILRETSALLSLKKKKQKKVMSFAMGGNAKEKDSNFFLIFFAAKCTGTCEIDQNYAKLRKTCGHAKNVQTCENLQLYRLFFIFSKLNFKKILIVGFLSNT
ncbi:hypothetical protein RFI_34927, partial [Reticulomyxa filosa]